MIERLEFDLLENAADYVLSAAEHARRNEPRHWKYAVLHLVAGIELVIKARLQEEHWSLLFADVDKASEEALEAGAFKSVDFETACKRLQNIAAINIDPGSLKHLKDLRELRHRVQHFAINVDMNQIGSLLAKGISFFVDFCQENLPDQVDETEMSYIYKHLYHFQEFTRDRLKIIQEELRRAPFLWDCPRCWQETLVIGENHPHCPFCGFQAEAGELAEQLGEGPMKGPCLKCGAEVLAFILFNNEDGACLCTSCGNMQRVCLSCYKHFIGEGDICPNCLKAGRVTPSVDELIDRITRKID